MSSEITSRLLADAVLEIKIDRPKKKNALTADMYADLADALSAAQAEDQIRVVILAGVEGIFSAGNDIADFVARPPLAPDAPVWRYFSALMTLEKPLIAVVDGMAIGAGATSLLHCDFVYASPASSFSFPFASVGLTPEGLSSLLLPLALGRQRSAALLLAGERLPAVQAWSLGLVNEVVAADAICAHAQASAEILARISPEIMKQTKRLIATGMRAIADQHFEAEQRALAQAIQGPAAQQFFSRFLAR
jgi:enoyl-CoA hydratase/carnithine racemase